MNELSKRLAGLSSAQRELLLLNLGSQAGTRGTQPEIEQGVAPREPAAAFDVVILGGGLAGQTLARQIRRARPSVSILVTELRAHPAPESAHKVGESTVEIGAHYFSKVLDLEHHLTTAQLRKSGLRYFFPQGANDAVAGRVEMGASNFPPVPSYQIDRGRFENFLAQENSALGVEVWDRCKAAKVTRDGTSHHVLLERGGQSTTVSARWVVDATGRAGLLKRQLNLARESAHNCNAVWFRLAGRIDPDEWSDAPEWRNRLSTGLRWLSTNHFMGRGYWVWFIPLAADATSVGIVADASLHPLAEMRSYDRALDWMRRHEPVCALAVENHPGELLDFIALKHYAHGCAQVFSGDRWALTGEAGVFTDPFYSPGSDFIGMSNTFITDLILRDLDGESIVARAAVYDRIYLNTFEALIRVYENQYPLMGNPAVMAAKIVWDFAVYWGFLALRFVLGRLCDLDLLAQSGQDLHRVNHLNARMQAFFREWDGLENREWEGRFIDVLGVDIMKRFHGELQDDLPGEALSERFSRNRELIESLAVAIFHRAAENLPAPPRRPVNPYAITLQPDLWERDGLFESGKTVEVDRIAARTMEQIRLTPASANAETLAGRGL